ncbi:MAG TPA: glycosyltransferase [Acidisarcina sp.]
MLGTPEVSVIVCFYNQAWVAPLIFSALEQQITEVSYEVLLCDDGSDDSFSELAKSWAESAKIDVRIIWQPHRGFRAARSRNNGIRCARGEILAFLDGDTWVTSRFIDEHWSAHANARRLVCGSRSDLFLDTPVLRDDLGAQLAREAVVTDCAELAYKNQWLGSGRPWMACTSGNFSISREPALFFDEGFVGWGSEDRDLAIRLWRAGCEVVVLPRPNAVHIQEPSRPKIGNSSELISHLRGKLLLRDKYPAGEMKFSLEMVKYCHFDPELNGWFEDEAPSHATVDEILDEFKRWCILTGFSEYS